MDSIETSVRDFVVTNFLFGQNGHTLKDDDSLLEHGVIDSTGVLELVSFLEAAYRLEIQDEELVPENLDSIKNLTEFIRRKRALRQG